MNSSLDQVQLLESQLRDANELLENQYRQV